MGAIEAYSFADKKLSIKPLARKCNPKLIQAMDTQLYLVA
jgi:hypothetical protein